MVSYADQCWKLGYVASDPARLNEFFSPNSPQPQGGVGVNFDGAHRVKKPLVAL
jgi:hypothetical protein